VEKKDYQGVLELSKILNSYNLHDDPQLVRQTIEDSVRSFQNKAPFEKRKFLFVAEDLRKSKIVGCSLILACHGSKKLPHLSFELHREIKKSKTLNISVRHVTCRLKKDSHGYTEIGGLVLLPAYRGTEDKIVKQLSLVRFALMASRPQWFKSHVLVEYLPAFGAHHESVLWQAIGRHFIPLDYEQADRKSAINKEFILSLFPKEKIYLSLLPKNVLEELDRPGLGAKASLKNIKKIGFKFLNQIDPFDGGPHYGAKRSVISWVRQTQVVQFQGATTALFNPSRRYLISALVSGRVRALVAPVKIGDSGIMLSHSVAGVLQLKQGDSVALNPF
jgi:arginine N-succinyltransferase